MEKIEYPKCVYHKELPAQIVQSKEEHAALGKGWEEAPHAKLEKQTEEADEQAPNQSQTDEIPDIKKEDFVSLTVAQLKAKLIAKGAKEKDLKGLHKDELIADLGAL